MRPIPTPDLSVGHFRTPYEKILVSMTHEINNDPSLPDQEWFYVNWFPERDLGIDAIKEVREVMVGGHRFVQIRGRYEDIIEQVNEKVHGKQD